MSKGRPQLKPKLDRSPDEWLLLEEQNIDEAMPTDVREFQRARLLPETGKLDAETYAEVRDVAFGLGMDKLVNRPKDEGRKRKCVLNQTGPHALDPIRLERARVFFGNTVWLPENVRTSAARLRGLAARGVSAIVSRIKQPPVQGLCRLVYIRPPLSLARPLTGTAVPLERLIDATNADGAIVLVDAAALSTIFEREPSFDRFFKVLSGTHIPIALATSYTERATGPRSPNLKMAMRTFRETARPFDAVFPIVPGQHGARSAPEYIAGTTSKDWSRVFPSAYRIHVIFPSEFLTENHVLRYRFFGERRAAQGIGFNAAGLGLDSELLRAFLDPLPDESEVSRIDFRPRATAEKRRKSAKAGEGDCYAK